MWRRSAGCAEEIDADRGTPLGRTRASERQIRLRSVGFGAGCRTCPNRTYGSGCGQIAAVAGKVRFDQVIWQTSPMLLVGTIVTADAVIVREPRQEVALVQEKRTVRTRSVAA